MNAKQRLENLLSYTHHLGESSKHPVLKVEQYNFFLKWQHQLKNCIGVTHDINSDDKSIWLRIERLKRISPPSPSKNIMEWMIISNDPNIQPKKQEKITRKLPESKLPLLIKEGKVEKDDIADDLNSENTTEKLKIVTFRLKNHPSIKDIDTYITKQWQQWSEKEKIRRKTIKIYEAFFSLQHSIASQDSGVPVELVWGVGIARWLCKGNEINYPLIEKQVEIEIDSKDAAILIYPRENPPLIQLTPYIALENPKVHDIQKFSKDFFEDEAREEDFSPYIKETFESVLRQASVQLSENGIYRSGIDQEKEGNKSSKISGLYCVSS